METTNELLDRLSAKYGNATDYRLSKLLSTSTPATVSNWRKGRSTLSHDYAVKVAELLEVHPAYVIACIEHERENKQHPDDETTTSGVWRSIANAFREKAAGILPPLALACLGAFNGQPVEASSLSPSSAGSSVPPDVYYGKSRKDRRRRKTLRDRLRSLFSPPGYPALVLGT